MTELVTYEKDESVAIITLDDGKANAVSHQLINELNAALDKAEEEKATVLLTGREGKFSAGFDLSVMKEGGPEAVGKLVGDGARLSQRLLAFPTPVIIACNGHRFDLVVVHGQEYQYFLSTFLRLLPWHEHFSSNLKQSVSPHPDPFFLALH